MCSEPSPVPQAYSQSEIFLIFHPSVWLTLPCCYACWPLWTHALNICCLSQSGQGWRHCFSCAHCPGHSLAVCSVFASKFTCRQGQLHETTRSLCFLPEKLTLQLKPCKSYLINSSGHTPQQCIGAENSEVCLGQDRAACSSVHLKVICVQTCKWQPVAQ